MAGITIRLPTSRHRNGRRSKTRATPSSPTWETSRRISKAGSPNARSRCRTRSIAFRERSVHELSGQLLQRLAGVALPQLAEYRKQRRAEPAAGVNRPSPRHVGACADRLEDPFAVDVADQRRERTGDL